MRVLWFSINSSLYISRNGAKAGHGGWIGSLEHIVRQHDDFQLGIAFESKENIFKDVQDGVTYYPMYTIHSKKENRKRHFNAKNEEIQTLPVCLRVIEDFQPDIIHIFGSEWCYGLLINYIKIPIVIHIQGSLPPYQNCALPPGISNFTILKSYGINIKKWLDYFLSKKNMQIRKCREEEVLTKVSNFMGRTEWDYNLTKLYNPNSDYYFCNEALNSVYVDSKEHWIAKKKSTIRLVTIGAHFLKGIDVLYKTAKLLKEHSSYPIEWHVVGEPYHDGEVIERLLGIEIGKLGIKYLGYLTPSEIKQELLCCDFYVHPAYAENSPNCICEAQIIGVPVIATFCGGISSLVKHKKTGFLLPINDPYSICSTILQLKNNENLQNEISQNEIECAQKRHNTNSIYESLLSSYHAILKNENKKLKK